MSLRRFPLRALLPLLVLFASMPAAADITTASLEIQGIGLSLVTPDPPVTTGIDIPTTVQTRFGGKENDEALTILGITAVGDLTGPGLDSPLELSTAPGHKFQIPGLSREGVYTLQNVRLMKGNELLQYSSPSSVEIIVADLFQTTVEVRQLTPDEIRARGIVIDARNFEVYEYTLSFLIRGETVKIPFPVIIDPRTRQVQLMPIVSPYTLPPISTIGVGRWTPPDIIPVTFEDEPLPENERNTPLEAKEPGEKLYVRPPIPAAIVIPNSLAVMHQFFAVVLTVQNGAPNGSTARLENVSARIRVPSQLRTATSKPAVALGQAVPLLDKVNGLTILVAQAKAEAEWSVEALKPGTHTIEIELRGTLKENGQVDVPMVARPRASVVVHDARFNIAFSHPDTVRKNIDYTTYSFITNTSPVTQTIVLSNDTTPCPTVSGANVCRIGGNLSDELTIPSGETRTVEYKLRSGVTGKVFATAAHIDSEVANATAQLHMGVSDTGVPLSPTTLLMPHYAQYVSESLVSETMQILGLGYSIATAPLTAVTATLPRVIKGDVYRRAVDIAQAGQAIFIANDAPGSRADAIAGLSIDLLGNSAELSEWDALRRHAKQHKYARPAGAAVTRELESAGLANGVTFGQFIDNFGKALSHRDPYVAALAHAPGSADAAPFALSVRGVSSDRWMQVPAEATSGWVRDLPYGELTRINAPGSNRYGELALFGRWTSEDLEVIVTPNVDGLFELELLYPNTDNGSTMRAHLEIMGNKDIPIRVPLSRGATTINAMTPTGGFADTDQASVVPLEPLRVLGIRQDLYLDENGHKASILFNRPVDGGVPSADLRTKFHGEIDFNRDGVVWNDEPRPISGAALQESKRVIDLTFDHVLTTNATYTVEIDPLVDPRTTLPVSFPGEFVPKIDNDRPAGIIYGRFIRGDNTPLGNHEVILFSGIPNPFTRGAIFEEFENPPQRIPVNPFIQPPQIATTRADGSYLFEYVSRDIEAGFAGEYRLWGNADNLTKYTYIDGSVRLPGRVHNVSLQLLGRGSAEGIVRFDNGEIAKKVSVTVGSTAFEGVRTATTDDNGFYRVEDLPVGPLAFTATDGKGNIGYAAGEIATPGEVEQQDISIYRQPVPKNGSVHGTIRRSDNGNPVAGASVGIFNNGYQLQTLTTDADGRYSAEKVPAGFISVVAAEWTISRQSANTDFDLKGDEVRQVDLILSVQPDEQLATVTGRVLRENPLYPGNASKYERVPGALVKIDGMRIVTADANGEFVIPDVPLTPVSRNIGAHDPATRRTEHIVLGIITAAGPNDRAILLKGLGKATVRARLFDARGLPAPACEMLLRAGGYYAMSDMGGGLYELGNVDVGGSVTVRTGTVAAEYGDQEAISAPVQVAFDGQIVSVSLRLPGQGEVRANVKGMSIPSDGGEPILTPLITDVTLSYSVFNSATLTSEIKEVPGTTNQNGLPGEAIYTKVPAFRDYTVTSNHPLGQSSANGRLAFDADLGTHTLLLSNLGHIRGVVYAIDGVTPVPGATVRMEDEHQDQGLVVTGLDGKFEFRNVAPNVRFRVVAESTQAGIYRTAEQWGNIPSNGGLVNTAITLLERGQIEGKVVYAAYKVYDPLNPANNVADNTPSDLSDNAPVPMARFWMRELDFPRRELGTPVQPLAADLAGRFAIDNVFVGRLRATAWSPDNPDLRGDWTATLVREGELLTPYIAIGGGGTGAILAKVTNPNANNAPVENAEVQLYRGGLFDLASTGPDGTVRFEQLPVGSYVVTAYSKALGKSGRAPDSISVTIDTVSEARVMLTFSGQVTGRLTDPESSPANQPVQGSHVTISMAEGFSTRFTTNALGEYLFEGVREGLFTLDAKDTASNRRAKASGLLSAADPEPVVNLELERTETLHVAVYLPDDLGANSGVLGGAVEATVSQRNNEFYRSQQGNPIVMSKLFLNESYDIHIQELAGERRTLNTSGKFPKGSASQPISFVYPAYGSGEVLVRRLGAAVPDALVSIRVSRFDTRVFYSDAAGRVVVSGLPLGRNYSVTVTTIDGSSGSGNLEIVRTSVLGSLTVEVGSRATVTGKVIAELGGPSIGTPVVIRFSGGQLTGTTDDQGSFTFAGVAAPSGIELLYYGPDGVTLGRILNFSLGAEWAGKTYTASTVTLDATPPLLLDIAPEQGAGAVPPDTHLKFVFSEAINTATVNNENFTLQPADGTPRVNATFTWAEGANHTFVVTMVPPAPPAGQEFPLKSNTLYRLTVSQHVSDLTGHELGTNRGLTFTTADYIEPRVISTVPKAGTPIPEQITYEFRFNEPLDPTPFAPNGNGVFQLALMSGPGETATVVETIPGDAYIDPFTGISLFFAPSTSTLPNSYYRIRFSGVKDLQGNVVPEQTYYLASFDTVKPFVILNSPVPGDASLVSGLTYKLTPDLRNGTADGTPATDIDFVDFFRVENSVETFTKRVKTAPFAYEFVAPDAPAAGLPLVFRASATDKSVNESEKVEIALTVKPNQPPTVSVALDRTADVFAGERVNATITASDEVIDINLQLDVKATRTDNTEYRKVYPATLHRNTIADPWPTKSIAVDLPINLKGGTPVTFTGIATDMSGLTQSSTTPLTLAIDTVAPAIGATTPPSGTELAFGTTYKLSADVTDVGTGVARVVFNVDGTNYTVEKSAAVGSIFTSNAIPVEAHSVNTTVPIAVTATDNSGNSFTKNFEVIYLSIDDPTVPTGEWLCAISGATLPANTNNYQLKLRFRAIDDISVTSVKFRLPDVVELVVPTNDKPDEYAATVSINTPAADKTDYYITAIVTDADPAHTQEFRLRLSFIVPDLTIDSTQAIIASNVANYEDKTVVVTGAEGHLVPHVPVRFKNLIVLNGGRVETLSTTTTTERKLEMTVTGTLYIDCASSVDVTGRGYLGSYATNPDGSGTTNDSEFGRTFGNTNTGGAKAAGASHAGVGVVYTGASNATYGSYTEPRTLGAGGGSSSGSNNSGAGGGAVAISGTENSRFIIAGGIRADGNNGAPLQGGGAGGSVLLQAADILLSPAARVTANGGNSMPGGGGRVALYATRTLAMPDNSVQARGGWNTNGEGYGYADGGAGTIYIVRPDESEGELRLSAFNEDHATSEHQVMQTPVGTPGGAALVFGSITVGPRAMLRIDSPYSVTKTDGTVVDPAGFLFGPEVQPTLTFDSTPAKDSTVAQNAQIALTYDTASGDGVGQVRISFPGKTDQVETFNNYPLTVGPRTVNVLVPANATPGPATLKVLTLTRSGRSIEQTATYTVTSDAAPTVQFTSVDPSTEIYAGGRITINASASDDIEVKSLNLSANINGLNAQPAVKPTPQTMTRQWTLDVPQNTPSNTDIVLTLSASDNFPSRPAVIATHHVNVRKDLGKPVVTFTKPTPNQEFSETANATFTIEVQATDAEVGVNTVKATFEGIQYTLQPVSGQPGRFSVSGVPVPQVDGTDPVAKTISVTATDFDANAGDAVTTIYIKPLIDANAPKLAWVCSSPNAMYPAGYAVALRVSATRPDGLDAGAPFAVQRVEYTVNGGAVAPMPVTATAGEYSATFNLPADAANGTVFNVRIAAFSSSGNEATLLATLTVVAGTSITTGRDISATDFSLENATVIVGANGVLTVTGPHTFANLIVLDGGKFVQKHLDIGKADPINVQRLFVACNGTIDVSGLGYLKNTTYPGAGNPNDASGGSHLGTGGLWSQRIGATFGSIYRPMEGGGGGQITDPTFPAIAGGGSVRIQASSTVTIDGSVKARVADNAGYGSAAGGSVWITTPSMLAGAGTIDVTGGNITAGSGGSGGGGSIALEYGTASTTNTLFSKLIAKAGTASTGHPGGAGTVYLKSGASTFGELTIDNRNLATTYGSTDLPAFGRNRVASVSGNTIVLEAIRWLMPALAGHAVRVIAPDGSVRGTTTIASVTNDPSTTPVNGFHEVPTQDTVAYDGYIYYSPAGIGGKKFVAVRYTAGQWQYDTDSAFTNFTPQTGDGVIATFRKDATRITELTPYRCATTCGLVNGAQILELAGGEIVPNAIGGSAGNHKWELGVRDNAELFLRSDGHLRGVIVSKGINASVTLADSLAVQPGDIVRGVYRLDKLTVFNARVTTEDLLEAGSSSVDLLSTVTSGNLALPTIDTAKLSMMNGLNAPTLIGAAGAVADTDVPVHVVAANANATPAAGATWNATLDEPILIGDRGGMSVRRVPNGHAQPAGLSTLNAITSFGFVSFSAAQTNQPITVGLAPADTTSNHTEPGTNGFNLLTNATYELWANGASVNKNAAYATSTVFRVEKTPSAIRWFVDGVLVHEVTTGIPASLLLDLSFQNATGGEIHSIEYDTSTAAEGRHRASVAANGSFKVPVFGQAGDAILLRAIDSHAYPFSSAAVQAITIGAQFGVQSLTVVPSELTGGRTATGTVTLRSAAGTDGVRIALSSSNSVATVPATVTIPAGQTSITFTITSTAVSTPVDVNITATYGNIGTTTVLHMVKDNILPTVTVVSPVANTQYSEGNGKIPVQANVIDSDSGVKRVFATFNGTTYEMPKNTSKGANAYFVEITAPFIDGTQPLPFDVVVAATDNTDNLTTAPAVTVVINPATDTTTPIVEWRCSSSNAMYPVGYAARLRVYAKIADPTKPALQSVQFTVTDPSGTATVYNAGSLGNDLYEYIFTVPDVADRSVFTVTARAITGGGGEATVAGSFSVIKGGVELKSATTIGATDFTNDGKALVIWEGVTVTINGTHTYDRVAVLVNGKAISTDTKFEVNATSMYVACGGSIDMTSRGYAASVTYTGATPPGSLNGGSHIGYGGQNGTATLASTYGSVYQPAELGGGGQRNGNGGGAVRIDATTLSVDGAIRSNGNGTNDAPAGGSVWLTATNIGGIGTIEARGGQGDRSGGGGAVAIHYTNTTDTILSHADAFGGTSGAPGGAGSVYLKPATSTYGTLRIDNGDIQGLTTLPSLGSGTAAAGTSGAALVSGRGADVPKYFEKNHWVRITGANDVVKGIWRIDTATGPNFTLKPNAGETIDLQVGDKWQGIYRFDSVTVKNTTLVSLDPIETGDQTVTGTVVTSRINAANLHIAPSGVLKHAQGESLDITVTGELTVDANGFIDLNSLGYAGSTSYPGVLPLPGSLNGGTHMGLGGVNATPIAPTYGSVYEPAEAGAGGQRNGNGGGILRIKAGTLTNNGTIRANGNNTNDAPAGGSIWITAAQIGGTGVIEARGGNGDRSGGGGAVAIEYTTSSGTVLDTANAFGGTSGTVGGAGTVYLKSAAATYGNLRIDNGSILGSTTLPSLGSGTALTGTSGAILATSINVPLYFGAHWVRVTGADNVVKGTWRVKSIAAKNITLKPNAGETISLQVGDKWQGIYRFDSVSVKNTTLVSLDPIESGDQTVSGTVITSKVRAENLRITPSSVLKHAQGESLDITVTGELTVDANAFIDLNNLGYAGGASYPDVLPLPGSLNGGTHMGHGGFNANPVAPTYGSVYQPAEAGAGGQRGGNTGSFGGGILRIQAGTLTNNGTIRANGNNPNDAPAGGSIWITAAQIGGTGVIEARGGNGDRSGGGGAVAIEYTTSSGTVLDTANAFGGTTGTVGGAGTVYLKSAAASYGSLRIDNGSILGSTTLPSLGSGTALTGTSGAILVTGSNVPLYFGAHWVRVTGTDNVVKGTWRVKSIAGKNITLKPNAAETISLQAGDKWQGIYLFDTVTVKNTTLVSLDPIETAEQVLNGAITANAVHATNLRLATGTVLKHAAGKTLEIDVAGELIIDAGASIDVTDLGYGASTSYPDALPLPGSLNGGTHIGQGGRNADPEAPVYGSVLHPAEYGAGGQRNGSGGGVVRIKAGTLTNNGFIRANGRNTNDAPAGGSIWITATNVGGIGTIEARGGNGDRSGGGGAVAIEYTSSSGTVLDNTNAFGGTTGPTGGPGTVYLKPASATYGNLRIDNGTTLNGKTTLPSLGKGTAADGTSGAMLNTGLAAVPLYFERHWVRVSDAAGNVKGTWRIARIDPINRALVELEPNGSETIDLQPGDLWQGLYRFDSVSIRNTTLTSFDPIESVDQTLTSNVVTSDIRTQNLRLTTGTVLKHPQGGKLEISATGEVLIDANAFIDANSLGYTASVSYPGATTPGSLNGGSHMGYGGFNATPIASVFGSLYRPSELGGGGQRNGNGGGIIRIKAGTLTNNGVIRANGNGTNDAPAGGSIWITATNLAGTGTVEAKGGQGDRSGGGGAVAVEYTTVTGPFLSNIFAYGGTSGTIGGAGTVYLKPASGTYGNLSILNGGVNGQSTGLPSLGTGTVKSVSGNAVVVTDRTSDIQPYFVGHWVEIKPAAGGDPKGTWRISAISGKTMTLAPNATESINVQAGDLYQGVYRFDNVTMRTTKVILGDPIRSTNPSDSGTTVIDLNAAPPDFPAAKRSQIVVASALTGDAVTAPAGAVTDPQTPIALVVTNNNSGATFTATANADGSFSVPVVGAAGHTFTVSATDAHVMPLSSSVQVNGAIVELNRVASLQVQPSTVTGGTTAFGTVRLIAPARASGVIVTLSSSASNVAAVPASVAIAGGASSAQFAIATSSPASTTAVQITATLMGASQSASLTITPDSTALVDVVLTSSTVEGGTSVDGTVVLGGPAPPGGALVMLSSTIPEAAAVPSTVLVPEGSSTAGFTITTSKVAAPVRTSITATWGASKAKDLDLTKCTAMTTATPPVSATMNTVWFDDAAPTGATASGDATFDSTQTATGTMALHFTASTAIRAWTFTGATALSVAPADRLVLYALVNPCNPPREILVQWSDATTQYRASWGEQRIGPRDDAKLYAGSLPVGGVWQRLEVIAKTLPSFPTTAKSFTGMTVSVDGGEAWIDTAGVASCSTAKAAKPSYLANETVWFDDAIPAGAVPSTTFNWDTAQVASGTSADLVGAPTDTGTVQHVFTGATAGFALNVEDVIVTYVFIDPCNPPREVMLQWNDGSNWSRRVYWGENLDNMGGTRQTVEHRRMGSVPEAGKWVRLEVPVSSMLMTGMTVRGMAFTVNGGRVWFDRVAKVPRVNLALGKLATQKTLHQNNPEWTADKVVDGNLDKQNFNHTDNELQTWWEVDLGSVQPIDAIDVWNGNPDCCASRLANFYVLVSDKEFSSKDLATTLSQPGVTAYYYMPKAGLPSPFDISRTGRYVRVQLAGANWLHITEVQVWAPVAPLPVNVAAGRSARQSSTLNGTYLAAQAVNGNALGESPSHTNNELEAWWQVDLGSVQQISTIDIDNDYASDVWPRMSNFYVFVSDDPFADTDKVANLLASPKVSAYYRTGPFNAFRYDINRRGRYVRIQLTGPNFLQPMEVRIWSPSLTIKALAKTPASF